MDWNKLPSSLQGYRTHIAAAALICVALLGLLRQIDQTTLEGLGGIALGAVGIFLRLAIAKLPANQQDNLARALQLIDALRDQLRTVGPSEPMSGKTVAPSQSTEPSSIHGPRTLRDLGGIAGCLIGMLCLGGTAAAAGPVFEVSAPPAVGANDPIVIHVTPESPTEGVVFYFRVRASNPATAKITLKRERCHTHCNVWASPGDYEIEVEGVLKTDAESRTVEVIRLRVYADPSPPPLPRPTPDDPVPPPEPRPTPVPDPPAPAPQPPSPPNPGPTPLPAGEFQVAEQVAAIVRKIDSPKRAAEAAQLADAAEALAAQIAAGTIGNVTEVLTRIGEGIKGLNSPAWSAVAAQFAAAMEATWKAHSTGRLKLTVSGGLVDKPAWATLLREIAIGLRAK